MLTKLTDSRSAVSRADYYIRRPITEGSYCSCSTCHATPRHATPRHATPVQPTWLQEPKSK